MASSGMTLSKILFTLINLFFLAVSVGVIYAGICILTDQFKIIQIERFIDHEGILTFGYILVALGIFVFVLSFLGCCGAIRQSPWMLGVFGSIMSIIVITQIVLCVLLFIYNKEVENISYQSSKPIREKIIGNYNFDNSSDSFTQLVDNVQKYLRCCGVVNGTTDWPYGRVPYSCCENNRTAIYTNKPLQEQYRVTANVQYCLDNKQGHYAFQEACLPKVVEKINKNVWYLGAFFISFALLQIMGILLSCCIAYSSKKSYHTI